MKRFFIIWTKEEALSVIGESREDVIAAARDFNPDEWGYEPWDVSVGLGEEIDEIGHIDQVVVDGKLIHLADATHEDKIKLGIEKPERPEGWIATPNPDDPNQGKLF